MPIRRIKLLYVHKSDDFVINDGEIKRINNAYGRFKVKKLIIKYVNELKKRLP